jgi:hypothetical protein
VRNVDHEAVRAALIADGWTITDDPLILEFGLRQMYVDLAFQRAIVTAAKAEEKIAVEIQSFVSPSALSDFYRCIGQYMVYRSIMARMQPDRTLYIAISNTTAEGIWSEPLGELLRKEINIPLLIFDPEQRKVTQWTV